MEKICGNCKHWNDVVIAAGRNSHWCKMNGMRTLDDMSYPRFFQLNAIPQFLKDWKPIWHDLTDPEPPTQQLVLMWYSNEPKPKVGFAISGIWYKSAGSRTPQPDFWTELP